MSLTPTSGQVAKLTWTLGSGTSDFTAPGTDWNLNLDPKNQNVSNFRDGRARASTLADFELDMTLVLDQADPPTKAATGALIPGTTGTVKAYVDATHYWELPVIVGKLNPKNSGMEDVVMIGVTFEANGTATPPAYS